MEHVSWRCGNTFTFDFPPKSRCGNSFLHLGKNQSEHSISRSIRQTVFTVTICLEGFCVVKVFLVLVFVAAQWTLVQNVCDLRSPLGKSRSLETRACTSVLPQTKCSLALKSKYPGILRSADKKETVAEIHSPPPPPRIRQCK